MHSSLEASTETQQFSNNNKSERKMNAKFYDRQECLAPHTNSYWLWWPDRGTSSIASRVQFWSISISSQLSIFVLLVPFHVVLFIVRKWFFYNLSSTTMHMIIINYYLRQSSSTKRQRPKIYWTATETTRSQNWWFNPIEINETMICLFSLHLFLQLCTRYVRFSGSTSFI